ncbi:hypothetical protein IJT17_08575 [bacterium]|nr:hypothetical protein [bacterium]
MAPLVPYKGFLWGLFYLCLGLFAIIAIWEVAVIILLRNADDDDQEDDPNNRSAGKEFEHSMGLLSDTSDPFQALLNQASSVAAESSGSSAASNTPAKPPEANAAANSVDAAPKLTPFNGAATLPVGVASKNLAGSDASSNPFRRVQKSSGEAADAPAAVPGAASKPVGSILTPKAPGGPTPIKPIGASASGLSSSASAAPSAPVASMKSEAPASAPQTFSGSATVAVQPGVKAPQSIPMGGIKPFAPSGAGTAAAGTKPAGPKPFGFAGMAKPSSPSASAAPSAKSVPTSGGGDDAWKKLLGQTGGRGGSDNAAGAATAPSGASAPASGGIKVGAGAGSAPRPSLSGAASGNTVSSGVRPASAGRADDPWKALLGNAGKGPGPKTTTPLSPSASPQGVSLGIKPDSSSPEQ